MVEYDKNTIPASSVPRWNPIRPLIICSADEVRKYLESPIQVLIFDIKNDLWLGEMALKGGDQDKAQRHADRAYDLLWLYSPLPHTRLSSEENTKLAELTERHESLVYDLAMM